MMSNCEVDVMMATATLKIVEQMYREEDRHFREWMTCEYCNESNASVQLIAASNQFWCEDCADQVQCEECGCWCFELEEDGICNDCLEGLASDENSVPADDWELTMIFADIIPPQLDD